MSKNYFKKIVDDKKHNRYLFILYVFTLLYGLSGIAALALPLVVIFLEILGSGKSLFFNEPIAIFRICTCSTYPMTVTFSLAFAWYSFTKRRYTFILIILLLPLINFLIAFIIVFFVS